MADKIFGIHGDALRLRSQRLSMLASNIANSATPGYKAKDLDFERAMQEVRGGSDADRAAKGNAGYRVPLNPSLDGNTVELSTEQTLFAENAVGYSTTLSFLEGRVATLTRALKGE